MKSYIGVCSSLALLITGNAFAQAPTGLTVISATSSQVQLSWTGSATSYTVQRAPVGGAYVSIATVASTSYTDTQIDPYVDFTYQVTAGTSAAAASNTVTAGPPPAGLSVAAGAPILGATPAPGYGFNISLVLDGNGDPAFAFIWADPNNKQDYTQTQLLFRGWDRAQAAWNPVVKLAVVGDVSSSAHASTSLAYDSSTKTFAVATEDDQDTVRLFTSTDSGATWALKKDFNFSAGPTSRPSLAVAGGNFHLVVTVSGQGLTYISGKLSADSSSWQTKIAPKPSGITIARTDLSPSLALDSAGNPGVAYYASHTASPGNTALFFWQPATAAAPVDVLETIDTVSSDSYVRMVFHLLNPRVAAGVSLKGAPPGASVNFIRSDNAGASWQAPVVLPQDGNTGTDYPFDIAASSQDGAAVAYGVNGVIGPMACGNPKLSLSSDLTHWTTCSAPNTNNFNLYPDSIQLTYGGNDKLLLFWFNTGTSQADTGVIMYREPPANQPAGPLISSVQDAESSRTTVVPGSWTAIYGANLAGTTRTWNNQDFNGSSLPVNLSGVSVTFNGLPAPVFFISPGQVDVQVPSNLNGSVAVAVTVNGAVSAAFTATAVPNAPSLFFYPAGGKFYPAAVFPDSTLVGDPAVSGVSSRRARPGDTVLFFVNGIAASPSGQIIPAAIGYTRPVSVTIGTISVTPSFTGLVAAGEYQMNVVIPTGLASGEYPIVVSTEGQSSTANVVLPVSQ